MNQKEKNQLWRIPLFFSLIVSVVYLLIFQKHGTLPSGSHFDLLNDSERALQSKNVFDGIINLPFELSRWLDILFTWLITTYIVRMTILGFADLGKEKSEEEANDKSDKSEFLSIGLVAGVIGGIVASIILTFISFNAGFLLIGLSLIVLSGLIAGVAGGALSESLGLGFSLTYGMSVCFLFAIFNVEDFSIALALLFGLLTTIAGAGGVYIINVVKLIFSGRNINKTEIENK